MKKNAGVSNAMQNISKNGGDFINEFPKERKTRRTMKVAAMFDDVVLLVTWRIG